MKKVVKIIAILIGLVLLSGACFAAWVHFRGIPSYPTAPVSPGGVTQGGVRLPTQYQQQAPDIKSYRPDSGQFMTDAEYTAYQTKRPLTQMQAESDISTSAQKGLMGAQAGYQGQAAAQQAAAQKARDAALAGYQTQRDTAQADYAKQAAANLASNQQLAAKAQADYETQARTQRPQLGNW